MTNILTHPMLRTNSVRMIRARKADIESKLERATGVLDEAISMMQAVDFGKRQPDVVEVVRGLGMVRDALSRIDPEATPHPDVLMRLARATDGLLSRLHQVGKAIHDSLHGGDAGEGSKSSAP